MSKLQNILIQKGLSNRQAQIAELVSTGLSNREISNQLFLTEKGVKWHLSNIYTKMHVKSRAQLIVWCLPYLGYAEPAVESLDVPLTQEKLNDMTEDQMNVIVDTLAYEAKYFNLDTDQVNAYIDKILKRERLSRGLFLRRNRDGISEAGWLLQKMIGEVLTNGEAAV